jgi:hypothetical protein
VHNELLTEFLMVPDQIRVEEVLVRIVFAGELFNDRGIELIADFLEIVGLLVVSDFAHRGPPALDVDAWLSAQTSQRQGNVNAFAGFAPLIYRPAAVSKREESMLSLITHERSHRRFSSCALCKMKTLTNSNIF